MATTLDVPAACVELLVYGELRITSGTGVGVYNGGERDRIAISLGAHATVFSVRGYGHNVDGLGMWRQRRMWRNSGDLRRQTSKAIEALMIASGLVLECHDELERQVKLVLVP